MGATFITAAVLAAIGLVAGAALVCVFLWALWKHIGAAVDQFVEDQFGDEPGRFE